MGHARVVRSPGPGKVGGPHRPPVSDLGSAARLAAANARGWRPGCRARGSGPGGSGRLAACGSEGAPTAVRLPCTSGGSNSRGHPSSGPRVTGAPAGARGHSSGGMSSPVSCGGRVARAGYVPRLGGSWTAGGGAAACRPGSYGPAQRAVTRDGTAGRPGMPYAKFGSTRPRLPEGVLQALPLGAAWCLWALGVAARAAPSPPGGVTVGARGVEGVSGSRVKRGLHCAARLCVSCRWRVPRPPGGGPSRVSAAIAAHHCPGHVLPARLPGSDITVQWRHLSPASQGALAAGGGGVLSPGESWPAWGSTAGNWPAPTQSVACPPPLLRSPSGVRGSVHREPSDRRAQTPGWLSPIRPAAGAIARASCCHLRLPFCCGCSCGGGGILGR